eukprot:UN3697
MRALRPLLGSRAPFPKTQNACGSGSARPCHGAEPTLAADRFKGAPRPEGPAATGGLTSNGRHLYERGSDRRGLPTDISGHGRLDGIVHGNVAIEVLYVHGGRARLCAALFAGSTVVLQGSDGMAHFAKCTAGSSAMSPLR